MDAGDFPTQARGASPAGLPASQGTIVACSSPPGPGQRAVLRASGPDCAALLQATLDLGGGASAGPEGLGAFLSQRGVIRCGFRDGIGTQPALVLWMPGPASYTREDIFELHLPGSLPLLDAALARLLALGARRAERGEFTRRAFVNGRLDLTRAEGVLELVSASTEREARAAQELLAGGLARRVDGIRERLENLRALTEASLDFDESDTGHVPVEELKRALLGTCSDLVQALGWELRRQPPSSLPRVVLVGAPNAGKSTLFNALVRDTRALVSEQAGTTRDWLEGLWDLGGRDVLLIDTAGKAAGATGVDRQAQEWGQRAAGEADLLLLVTATGSGDGSQFELPADCRRLPALEVRTKSDLGADRSIPGDSPERGGSLAVEAPAGIGLEALARAVGHKLGLGLSLPGDGADPVHSEGSEGTRGSLGAELFARHRSALEQALDAADRAAQALTGGVALDWVAEALREATDALDGISGRTSPEDLLDRIFARFCLGK